MRFVVVLFFVLHSCCYAQRQYTINFMPSSVRQLVKQPNNSTADSAGVLKEAQNTLSELQFKGFLSAHISQTSFSKDTATIFLTSGPRYKWVALLPGNVPPEVLRQVGWKSLNFDEQVYRQKELEQLFQRLLGYYENSGQPFASVGLDSVQISQTAVGATLTTVPGPIIKYDSLNVVGSAKINSRFMQTYLGVKSGHLYREQTISALNDRLRELPYLKVLRAPQVDFSNANARVTVFADQRNANQFDGILGLLQNPVDNKLQVVGNLKLLLQNAFRGGELIDLNYQGLQQKSQLLEIKAELPHVLQTDFGLQPSFKLFKQDTSFLNVNMRLGVNYLLRGRNSVNFFVERQSTSLIASASYENASVLPAILDANTNFYGLGWVLEKLDYRFNPRKGFSANTNLSVGTKSIQRNAIFAAQLYDGIPLRSTSYRLFLHANAYLPLGRRVVFAANNETGVLQGQYLLNNELFRLGGQSSLRGFNELSIYASQYVMGNAELRYILAQNSFLFAFYNQAYVQQKTSQLNVTDFPLGFGAGMNVETQVGILSISYALGKQKNNPLNLRQGKIHFGIVALF